MKISEYLNKFKLCTGLVVGDVMLDEYIFGTATRISPEAPVMVVEQTRTSAVPGGAANVAMNIQALGAKCRLIGLVGNDSAAHTLKSSLKEKGIHCDGIIEDSNRPTTRKTRVIANHSHQVLRVDHESHSPTDPIVRARLLDQIQKNIEECQFILLSDYAKGCLTLELAGEIIEIAKSKSVPVIANPKPSTAYWYKGATLVSLNRFEASATSNNISITKENAISVAQTLLEKLGVECVVITLGGEGMAGVWKSGVAYVPPVPVEVYDEAGAGDTAIATLALCIGAADLHENALLLAVSTSSSVVRKVGVSVPNSDDLNLILQKNG